MWTERRKNNFYFQIAQPGTISWVFPELSPAFLFIATLCLAQICFCPREPVSPGTSLVKYDKMLPTKPPLSRDQGACLSTTSIVSIRQVHCPKTIWSALSNMSSSYIIFHSLLFYYDVKRLRNLAQPRKQLARCPPKDGHLPTWLHNVFHYFLVLS